MLASFFRPIVAHRGFQPAAWLLWFLLPVAGCATNSEPFEVGILEQAEERTEALANDLLALSLALRDRDAASIRSLVTDEVRAAAFPSPSGLTAGVKWVRYRDWRLDPEIRSLRAALFVDSFLEFLEHFEELEDVRFKVKAAQFDGSAGTGAAHLKFFFVGRNRQGQREWLKGFADVDVESIQDGPWRITRLQFREAQSKVSSEDLFHEVSLPAGVAAVFPPFGVGRNEGFVSHGAAVADVNNDGLLDLAASGVDRNYLYVNRGDGTFEAGGPDALVMSAPTGSGVLFLDYDNDGDSDLFFAAVGNQILLENRFIPEGRLYFLDVSDQAHVDVPAVGFSAVSADVNGDSFPDIYVCSYNRYGTVMPDSWHRATNGTPNLLLINQRDGTFRESAAEWSVDDARWSYAAAFIDIDTDGDQDLYVANDFGENAMYRNDGGRFSDVAVEMGLVDSGFGMGVSFGDYDNDEDFDLHVTNMSSTAGNRILELLYPEDHEIRRTLSRQAAGNSLYRNDGDGTFQDVTEECGGLSGGWAFGGGFVDFDNDGWEDLYSPNGFVSGKTMKDT